MTAAAAERVSGRWASLAGAPAADPAAGPMSGKRGADIAEVATAAAASVEDACEPCERISESESWITTLTSESDWCTSKWRRMGSGVNLLARGLPSELHDERPLSDSWETCGINTRFGLASRATSGCELSRPSS